MSANVHPSSNKNIYLTGGINDIFDLYVAYGLAECLLRAGKYDFRIIPRGEIYFVETSGTPLDIEHGMRDALTEMLEEHRANIRDFKRPRYISDVDFCRGANLNVKQWGFPAEFEKILNEKEIHKYIKQELGSISNAQLQYWRIESTPKYTVPITLMPIAGKFTPMHLYEVKENIIKVGSLEFALAWIGFHYYTPYVKYNKGDAKFLHVYAIVPLEPIDCIETATLKDLKVDQPHYSESRKEFMIHGKLALLYHLTHTESLTILEVLTRKCFMLKSYTIASEKKAPSIRDFKTESIGKLMDFIGKMKKRSLISTMKFIDDMLETLASREKEIEPALAFVDAILYDRPENFYYTLRSMKRHKLNVDQRIVEVICEHIK
ncbi:MAG: type I-A CRISPR-associated protein Cas8a2/Csa4 [Candidatus Korarchaeota archaeon]